MSSTKLFSYWRSSSSYRVRICLNLKQIPYETVAVNLLASEHLSDEHAQRNPARQVPVLQIDGKTLVQSLAIISYLDATRPEPALVPADPQAAFAVNQFAHLIAMNIQPVTNLAIVRHQQQAGSLDQASTKQWMQHWMRSGLDAAESLAASDGPYVCGREVSLADVCLVPQLYNATRWGLDIATWPRLERCEHACMKLDAFIQAAPEQQPDAKPN